MSAATMTAWVVGAVVIGGPAYYAACWFWPYTSCGRCGGGGRKRSPSGKNWRPCRKCKGSGTRLRTGRKIANWLRGERDAAR
jgi:hypothetical protein